ncbi:MAG: hypothetical protein HQM14_16595 [SAR324 cluster bacterium]|nr:hypothetical protein [SAR324 cluster bacterium]
MQDWVRQTVSKIEADFQRSNDVWLKENNFDIKMDKYQKQLENFYETDTMESV